MSTIDVTDLTFEAEVLRSDVPVVVEFWAEWCGPCRLVSPVLDELSEEYAGRVKFVKIDTEANPGLSEDFKVQSIPYMAFFTGGEMEKSLVGARPKAMLKEAVEELLAAQA
ncbi:thioredoxin [Cellulomonas wangsupingiae]|uniref:Thioredoxin n=1 Tax=Cellulomonas wangsupingiae TaxID=2968085 RepID=A0ABY5K3W7_9CELL|nr:thioredoxin [Cellulomonas wangsupingiae]MCC2333904.1 thioredoxin [Cellulomonas wangsupingiae]MCM0639268.1 thioredoxin [Cellulomonas wangsupingiae]UUI65162.1 thioredoxin [Cellulomonas wangsupingiae]